MTSATTSRPERLAADVSKRGSSPGATTGGSGGDDATPGKGKSKKIKLVVLVLVLLVVGGAIAKFTVLASPAKPAAGAHKTVKKPAKGPVIPLDDMTLNLTDGHYLRLKLSLQTAKGTSTELDTAAAAQAVIDVYSNLTVSQLTGSAARKKYQDLLLTKLQAAYPKEIIDVPYTEFVMT